MSFIDAHAHLTHDENEDVDAIVNRAREKGVQAIINVAIDKDDLARSLTFSKTHPLYTVAALTPHDADKNDAEFFAEVKKCAENKQLAAIGEIGLDYFYKTVSKEAQVKTFKRYLELAREHNLPVVIHCREAFDDLYAIINEVAPDSKVMLHCFTGTVDEAKRAQDKGWYISFSGIVTFAKSVELQNVCRQVALEYLLIETDSPYLAPQGYRGKKNEPAYLIETAKFVANLRGIALDELAKVTCENVKRLFYGIP